VQAKAKVCHACGFASFFQLKKEDEGEKPSQIKIAMQRYAELARSLKKIVTTAGSPSLYDHSQRFSD